MNIDLATRKLEVLERRKDGSGRVRMPIGCVATIDRALTHGGGADNLTLGKKEWGEVVANFPKRKKPVPVYFGHIDDGLRDTTPAAGFVESVDFDGTDLWGTIDLGPSAFDAVVNQRGYRSASVEIRRDAKTPTEELTGWALFGLAITNNPALPVEYSIAASQAVLADSASVRLTVEFEAPRKENGIMSEQLSLTALQADKIRLEAEVAQRDEAIKAMQKSGEAAAADKTALSTEINELRIKLASVSAASGAAETRVKDLEKSLDATKAENVRLTADLKKVSDSQVGAEVTRIVRAAVGRGVDPAFFDGSEKDPVAWMSAKFANLEAFKSVAEAIPGHKGRVISGTAPRQDEDNQITEATRVALQSAGVDPKYFTVQNEHDLAALRAKKG